MCLYESYESGLNGLEQDSSKADEYLQMAAKYGHPDALYYLGSDPFILDEDDQTGLTSSLVEKQKGIEYLKKACERKSPDAFYVLALFYEFGYYVPQDSKKAYDYYRKAYFYFYNIYHESYLGFDWVDFTYRYLQEEEIKKGMNGLDFTSDDSDKKENSFLKRLLLDMHAAQLSQKAKDQFRIGMDLYHGFDYPSLQDKKFAYYWFDLASKKKDPDSLMMLGLLHMEGKVCDYDLQQANKYFEEGIKSIHAKYFLGKNLIEGNGIEKDIQKGIKLLTKAASKYQKEACLCLANVYKQGYLVPKDEKKAKKYEERSNSKLAKSYKDLWPT